MFECAFCEIKKIQESCQKKSLLQYFCMLMFIVRMNEVICLALAYNKLYIAYNKPTINISCVYSYCTTSGYSAFISSFRKS